MAETLRELVVSLSLQSDNFSKNIKSINAQIKEAESNFKAAGAGVDGFATSADGLKSKLDTLGTKLGLQKQAVEQYQKALDAANGSLEKAATKNSDLKTKLDAAKTSQSALKTEVEKATAAWDAAKKAFGENSDEANKLGVEMLELKDQYKAASDEVKALEGQVSASNTSLHTQADRVTKANTALNNAKTAYGDTEAAIKSTKKALEDSESAWEKAQDGFEAVGKKATDVGKKVQRFGKDFSLYVSAPLAALGGFAYNAATKYESAFAGVRKTTDGTEEDFAALNTGLLEMSERTPISYTDLAGTMEIAGQLGVEGVDNLLKFTETMAALGVSTNLSASDGATALARFANITGMPLENVDRLGAVIVALGNNYATTEAEIATMATRMASASELVGFSETEILALSAALSSMGIEAEAGGSAAGKLMKDMQLAAEIGSVAEKAFEGMDFQYITRMNKDEKYGLANQLGISDDQLASYISAYKAIQKYSEATGQSTAEFAKSWDANAAQTMLSFFEGLSTLDEGGQKSVVQMLDEMGLTEIRLSNLIAASASNTEGFASALGMANKAWEENTALVDEATKRYETQESKNQMLANRASNTASNFGENITKMLDPLMGKLNEILDWFNSFDEETQNKIITVFGVLAVGGPVVTAIGGTIKAVGDISTGIGKVIGAKDAIIAAMTGPAGWITLAVAGAIGLGVALSNIKSDMEIITGKAAAIELKIDESSKNETIQAIAEVRKEIEELSGGETSEKGAGVIATVKAGYGTSDMYGQALAYASSEASAKITAAGADYQAQIDSLNAQIVAAVEAGDQAAADELAKQRDQTYSAWDAEVLAIKEAHTQSISELVDGMAAQYPEAKSQIENAMEQYSALKAIDEFFEGADDRTEEESRALAEKILGMDGLKGALAEWGHDGKTAAQIFSEVPFAPLAEGLRDEMARGMADALEGTADSPIYTVLDALLSDAGAVEGLDFSALDGALADGIALLDFKAAAEMAQEKGGDVGEYLTDGLGAGISANVNATNSDLLALRDAVIKQTRKAFEIESPSKVMAKEGEQIPAGMALGINRGAYKVKDAMIKMARDAVAAAKKELVIESPSRVLRDEVGVMMARGIGEGVLAGSEEQQRVMANAARQMADSAVSGANYDNRRTYNQQSTVSLAGANLYVRDDQDIYALATEIAALTKRQQRGRGIRG